MNRCDGRPGTINPAENSCNLYMPQDAKEFDIGDKSKRNTISQQLAKYWI